MSKWVKRALIAAGIVLVIVLATYGLPPNEICEGAQPGHKDCASYGLPRYLLIEVARYIESHTDLIIALSGTAVAAFTYTLWRATDKLWTAGERQLTHNEDTSKRQLRAYMGINEYALIPYQLAVIGTGKFRISMKNFGQTPAIRLTTTVSYAIRTWVDTDTRPDTWDFETAGFPIDVAPGAPMFREINFAQHAVELLEELDSGDYGLWVRFCAAYQDIFKRRHEQTTLFYSRRTSYRNGLLLPIDQTREQTTDVEE
jgi:hypothetical protein